MASYQGGMPEACLLCGGGGTSATTGFCAKCDNAVLAVCDTEALKRPEPQTEDQADG